MVQIKALMTWLALLFLTALSAGLELDLDLDAPVEVGSRAACAVLRCVEDSQDSAAHVISTSGLDHGNYSSNKYISSLAVFKKMRPSKRSDDSNTLGVMVASVTLQQPTLTRVSNGVKVDGVLDGARASLVLEIVNSSDCLADFTCQLRSVDANGAESVSTSHVHQSHHRSQKDSQSSISSASVQILDLVHQLDVKLMVLSKNTEKLNSKVGSIESNLNTKMASVISKVGNLESKSEQVENKVDALENRLEDKIKSVEDNLRDYLASLQKRISENIENGVKDKLDQMYMQMIAFNKNAVSCTYSEDMRKSFSESLTALGQQLEHEQTEAVKNLVSTSQNMMSKQDAATDSVLLAAKSLTHTYNVVQKDAVEKLSRAVGEISEISANVSKVLVEEFALLDDDLQANLHQLASDVNESTAKTLSAASKLFLETNSTTTAALENLLTPKRCTRGMAIALPHKDYPYPLVQPTEDSVIDVPYLCDTSTDGGGWIIIQRRTTGDVDFYRGWEEYKNGFGDLSGEFWIGNEHIHKITSSGAYQLRVELIYQGKSYYAQYGSFSIADEANNYTLHVADYSGTAGNSLITYDNGKQFTTLDRDNDPSSSRNCANRCTGAWWYDNCGYSNLNGKWDQSNYNGLFWYTITTHYSATYSEMKIRHLAVF